MLEKTELSRTAINGFVAILKLIPDLPCVRGMLLKKKERNLNFIAGTQNLLGK